MKKFLILLALVGTAFAQNYNTNFVSARADAGHPVSLGVTSFVISWTPQSSVLTCSVQVDSSADGVSWGNGDLIASQNCATAGTSAAATLGNGKSYIRINVTALTGNGGVNVSIAGASGSGSSLPTATAAGQVPVSSGAGATYAAQSKGYFDFRDYGAVADDATDNCTVGSGGNAVSAFTTAVNAYSGPGIPTAFIGMGSGDKAYLVQTCSFIFTQPVNIVVPATLDFGTNSGTNGIQIGPTGLGTYQTPAKPYTLTGGGTIIGGASLTSAVISLEQYLTEVQISQINCLNAGGSGNWFIKAESSTIGIPGVEISHIICWYNDSVVGRNGIKLVSNGTGNTTHLHDVHLVADNGSVPSTACGGTGVWIGSPYGKATDLEVFGYGAPIIVSNSGGTNQEYFDKLTLDDNACTRGGVGAPIQLGDPSKTGTIASLNVSDSTFLLHAGDSGVFALTNDTTGANFGNFSFYHNQVSGGSSLPLAAGSILTTACNATSNCLVYGNNSSATVNNNVPTIYSGDVNHSIRGYYDGSEYTFTANSGTQFQLGGGNNFSDPFMLMLPSTGEIQAVPSGTGAGAVFTTRGLNNTKAMKGPSYCESSNGPTTLATGGTTTDTTNSCLPANAIIDAVVYRITTTITTAASFTIGDATTAARFCSTQSTLTVNTTGICFAQADQTGAAGPRQTSAAKVRVTTNVNPGAGAIRLTVFYHTWQAPTT